MYSQLQAKGQRIRTNGSAMTILLYPLSDRGHYFQVAIAILSLLEPVLVDADFDGCLQMLGQLPSEYSDSDPLFKVGGNSGGLGLDETQLIQPEI